MFKQILGSPWAGAVGALLSIVWEALLLLGPPLGLSGKDWKLYYFWGLVALAISIAQAFFSLVRENRHLAAQLDKARRLKEAKTAIGKLLEQLAECEREAYGGSDGSDYDRLFRKIEQIKLRVREVATDYLDPSFESRFLAVNVLDVQLDEATKMHFISRTQESFWTMYQQLKGWRACLVGILQELGQ